MAIYVPSSDQIFRNLAALGEGIASILDPHAERRRRVQQFLMENPDRAAALSRMQGTGEEGQEAGAEVMNTLVGILGGTGVPGIPTDPNFQPTEPVNVLGRGFDQEALQEALMLTGTETPQEQIERRRAEEGIEVGEPEATARASVAESEATIEESRFRAGVFSNLDPMLASQARNLEAARDARYSQEELQSLEAVQGLLENDPELRLAFAGQGGRAALSAILARERLSLRERLARLRAAESAEENRIERIKARVDLRNDLNDRMDSIQELVAEQPEGWEEMIEARVQEFNETAALLAEVDPRDTAYVGEVAKGTFGSLGIQFEPVPGTLEGLASRPELLSTALKLQTVARTEDVSLGDMMQKPGFRRLVAELPEIARQQFIGDLQENIARRRQDVAIGEGPGLENVMIPLGTSGQTVNVPIGDIKRITNRIIDDLSDGIRTFYMSRTPEGTPAFERMQAKERREEQEEGQ